LTWIDFSVDAAGIRLYCYRNCYRTPSTSVLIEGISGVPEARQGLVDCLCRFIISLRKRRA